MARSRWLLGLLCVGVASTVTACGDDDGGGRRDAAVDAAPGGDSGAGGGSLQVVVERVAMVGVSSAEPFEGAAVTADLPGGGRVEATSGADGRAVFEGVEWALGEAAVTAYAPGHVVAVVAGITDSTGEVTVLLVPQADSTRVRLSGTAAGMMSGSNPLLVGSTQGGYSEATGATWEMEVPVDMAGTLVATEFTATTSGSGRGQAITFLQWTTVDYPAPTADATADIDFAASVASDTVTGSFAVPTPARMASALGDADAFVRVSGRDASGIFLGAQTRLDLSTDGASFEYDLEYLSLAGVEHPTTTFIMARTPEQSAVTMAGWPTDGPQEVQFLDPPTVLAPEFGVDLAWGDTLRWETASTDQPALIQITTADDDYVMYVLVLPGRSSVAFPELPSGVTAAELFPGGAPSARVGMCEPGGSSLPGTCPRFANSRSFGLLP